jgi:hypothetical protein
MLNMYTIKKEKVIINKRRQDICTEQIMRDVQYSHVVTNRAVESVHKSSDFDSNSSIFKTSDSDSI